MPPLYHTFLQPKGRAPMPAVALRAWSFSRVFLRTSFAGPIGFAAECTLSGLGRTAAAATARTNVREARRGALQTGHRCGNQRRPSTAARLWRRAANARAQRRRDAPDRSIPDAH